MVRHHHKENRNGICRDPLRNLRRGAGETADFYRNLLGWQIEQLPGLDYWRVRTSSEESESISGGLLYRPIPEPRSWVHYVHVESIDTALAEVQRLGGSVLRPKAAVPRTAWYAVVADPQGNMFAIWQADASAFPMPEPH
ncbi:MAG TPA: VOC family protein [Gemmataceae bacterium]|nr:VOC family protein [Gemmataceae bacterium]